MKDEEDDERVKEYLRLKPYNIQRRELLSSASTGNKMLEEMQRASEEVVACSDENISTLEAVVAYKNDKVYATHFTINHYEIRQNTVQVTEKKSVPSLGLLLLRDWNWRLVFIEEEMNVNLEAAMTAKCD